VKPVAKQIEDEYENEDDDDEEVDIPISILHLLFLTPET
jgi:hypothetical protein